MRLWLAAGDCWRVQEADDLPQTGVGGAIGGWVVLEEEEVLWSVVV